jgi:hypothetical protein
VETLTWVVFESPAALAVPVALLLFFLLVRWRRGGSPRPLAAAALVSLALFIVQAAVVTAREHAARVLAGIERDLLDRRVEALRAALADDFHTQGLDRERFLDLVRQRIRHIRVHWLQRTGLRIAEREPDRFVVLVSYLAQGSGTEGDGLSRSSWRVAFGRRGGAWKIVEAEPRSLDGIDVRSWERLGR